MHKALHLGLFSVVVAGAAVLTMRPEPAFGAGCSARPSGAPTNLQCELVYASCNSSGWCQCDYECK